MTVRLLGEPQDELERRFVATVDGKPVIAEMPSPEYLVTYGCGVGVIVAPEGGIIEWEDHLPNCEHGVESRIRWAE